MKKTLFTLIFIVIFSFFFMSIAYADEEKQCWSCTIHNGRCRITCDTSICYYWECNDQPLCRCDGSSNNNSNTSDTTPPKITIVKPLNNSVVSGSAELKVQTDEYARIYYKVDNDIFKTLCSYCKVKSTNIALKDGRHKITVKAFDNNNNFAEGYVYVTSDSIPPRIKNTYPDSGEYSNGNFTVSYNELDARIITVYYKGSGETTYRTAANTNCPSGKDAKCSVLVDLSQYDGQTIKYYMSVKDGVNIVYSEEKSVLVDFSAPTLTVVSPQALNYNKKSINFQLSTNEPVTMEYIADGGRIKRLCSKCTSYSGQKSFQDGPHNVLFKVTDKAGNVVQQIVQFSTDSKKPLLKSYSPDENDVANGHFKINFVESNLKEANLFYKEYGASSFIKVPFPDCTGADESCELDINLGALNNKKIEFYYQIMDYATVVESEHIIADVDSKVPSLIIISPVAQTYQNSNVKISAVADEEVYFTYNFEEGCPKRKKLCYGCIQAEKDLKLTDGIHTLNIYATDKGGSEVKKTIVFYTDTKEPMIRSVEPSNSVLSNGKLTVNYKEENLRKVSVFYKGSNQQNYNEIEVQGCLSGSKMSCTADLNLLTYQGQKVDYYFTISDDFTTVSSDVATITVDEVSPSLQVAPFDDIYYSTSVNIDVDSNEIVDMSYSTNGGQKFTSLCTSCTSYHRAKTFSKGTVNLVIKAVDRAGNVAIFSDSFVIA